MSVGSNYSRLGRRPPDAIAALTRRVRALTLLSRRVGAYVGRIARFRGAWHTLCPWLPEHENTNVTPHDRSDDLSRVFGSGSVLLCSRPGDAGGERPAGAVRAQGPRSDRPRRQRGLTGRVGQGAGA